MERTIFHGFMVSLGMTLLVTNFIILPVLLQMFLYTLPIIYIGCHLSLRQAEVDFETGERPMKSDSISHKEAMLFPVIGSCALCSLYVAYKFFDPWYVNLLLTTYLTVIGSAALAETITLCLNPLSSGKFQKSDSVKVSIPFWPLGSREDPWCLVCSWNHVLGYVFSLGLSVTWIITKNWVIHNLFACSFCIQAISLVSVGSFTIASILLSGLFLYDIFWVFGTEVMVTVAKMFEAPAKLIFPVSFDPWQQSILGLGDIVIPGIFIAMCLRFDNHLHSMNLMALEKKKEQESQKRKEKSHKKDGATQNKGDNKDNRHGEDENQVVDGLVDIHEKFHKFYFWVVSISYELGLLTTGIVMFVFRVDSASSTGFTSLASDPLLIQHPQPALLYLVPYCLFSLFGAAALNGQVKEVLAYREDEALGLGNQDSPEGDGTKGEVDGGVDDNSISGSTSSTKISSDNGDDRNMNQVRTRSAAVSGRSVD